MSATIAALAIIRPSVGGTMPSSDQGRPERIQSKIAAAANTHCPSTVRRYAWSRALGTPALTSALNFGTK